MIRSGLTVFFCIAFLVVAAGADGGEQRKKLKVKSVRFEGNEAFSDRQLEGLMITRPYRFYSRSYYYPEVLDDDLKNLVLFYQQNGYLEAAVTGSHVEVDSTRAEASIEIDLSEGEMTLIEGIAIFGATAFSDSLLAAKTKIRKGDPFKRNKVQDAMLDLLSLYADNGYIDAEINPDIRVNSESHRALVDVIVTERSQSHIGDILIKGLVKTKNKVVQRELLFHQGEVARYSSLLESQRQLYLTGLFKSVFIRPVSKDDSVQTRKDILIDLNENESVELNFYIGYGSVEQVRGRIELANNNIRGSGRKMGLATYLSFISYGAEASFSEPWTFGYRWKTDINLLYGYREETGYNIERIGGHLVFGHTITNRSNISLTYRYERSYLSNVTVAYNEDELVNDIRSIKLSTIYDTRDNLFDSRRGVYLEWSSEIAGSFLRGSDDFWKLLWDSKIFHSLGHSTVIASAIEVGWSDYFGRSTTVPLNERFYLGGPDVLRGFEYRMVGPLDESNKPLGGNFKIALNLLELRKAIYKMMGGVVFVDTGNVWPDIRDARIEDMRSSAGIELNANTSIGIVRCGYGIILDRRGDEPAGRLYFSVGQAF